jgi:CheY-like chemotaxis protein
MLGLKILVCDDEDYILQVVSMKLREAGYRVTCATDGPSALDSARRDRPDLLITDLQMPGFSGIELCRQLSLPLPTPVPAILLTARAHFLEGVDLPPNLKRVISKPFSPRQLIFCIRETLEAELGARDIAGEAA